MERNITLDYLKIMLSVCIILHHMPFVTIYPPEGTDVLSKIGYILGWEITYSFGRIAVPLFFLINGYFLELDNRKRTFKSLFRLIKLFLIWSVFYLPCYYPYLDFKSFCIIFVTGYFQLWYFPALIGSVVILYILNKLKMCNPVYLLIISLFVFIIGYYIQYQDPYDNFEMLKYRNFLFFGFPMVSIGVALRKLDFGNFKKYLPSLIAFSFILLLVEAYVYMCQQRTYNLYFSFYLFCPLVLMYAILNGKKQKDDSNGVIPLLSTAIFLVHPIVIRNAALLFDINAVSFPYVVVLSFLLAFVLIKANKIFKVLL